MSLSPETRVEADLVRGTYGEAWKTLARRIQQGNSFSGHERNCVFLNTDRSRFVESAAALGLDYPDDARALAVADWDYDGDLDLWMTNRNGPRLRFWENRWADRRSTADGESAGAMASAGFVAVLLEGDPGQGCNRDAVGARAELQLSGAPRAIESQVRLVQSGDGFLSQSSRWLHFAVPAGASIRRFVVRWPGKGALTEEFAGLQPGRFFRIRQGRNPEPWQPPVAGTRLPAAGAADPDPPDDPAGIRNRLVTPVLVPPPKYVDLAGNEVEVREGPVLIELWATWCGQCEESLREIAEKRDLVSRAGLRVVALCVDGVAEPAAGGGGTPADTGRIAAEALEKLAEYGYPFEAGLANDELVEALDSAQRPFFYRQRRLPLPAAFLIDQRGYLSIVYKGPYSIEQAVADVELLQAPPEIASAQALPLGNRSARSVFVTNPIAVARAFLQGDYTEDARNYLVDFLSEFGSPPIAGESEDARRQNGRLAEVYLLLGIIDRQEDRFDEALGRFREAVRYNARSFPAHMEIGRTLGLAGRSEEAAAHYQGMLKVDPENPDVLNELGVLAQGERKFPDALGFYKRAVAANPRFIPGLNNLAWLLATCPIDESRDSKEALRLAELLKGSPAGRTAAVLDTLAAAYAENALFADAIRTALEAEKAAMAEGDKPRADRIRERLERYRNGEPIRLE